ncbi:MAG: hypothetical protein ACRDQ7_27745 [Haloechinothrix sp.]
MTETAASPLARSDLAHAAEFPLIASGVFQFQDASYDVQFITESGLLDCLDYMTSRAAKPATPSLYLSADGYEPSAPEWSPSNLRFDFDRESGLGAAVLLVVDKHDDIHAWMTHGGQDRSDVHLAHDSWNPNARQFPPWAVVDLPHLREAICQWAFGDVIPPPAVGWTPMPDEEIGWS